MVAKIYTINYTIQILILLRILPELLSEVIQLSRDKTFPSILLLLYLQKEKKEETQEKIRFQSEVCQQTAEIQN